MCIMKKLSHIFFEVTKLCLPAKGILAVKGYNIPLHPPNYLLHPRALPCGRAFLPKPKRGTKRQVNVFGGEGWTAPCVTAFNKSSFERLTTAKSKSEGKKVLLLKNMVSNSAMKLR